MFLSGTQNFWQIKLVQVVWLELTSQGVDFHLSLLALRVVLASISRQLEWLPKLIVWHALLGHSEPELVLFPY